MWWPLKKCKRTNWTHAGRDPQDRGCQRELSSTVKPPDEYEWVPKEAIGINLYQNRRNQTFSFTRAIIEFI